MKTLRSIEKNEIIVFSAVVMALSSLICFIAYKMDDPNVSILAVFTPTMVALILTAITKGKKGIHKLFVKQTVRKISLKWFLLSIIGIPSLATLAVLTSLEFDIYKFNFRTIQLLP